MAYTLLELTVIIIRDIVYCKTTYRALNIAYKEKEKSKRRPIMLKEERSLCETIYRRLIVSVEKETKLGKGD